MSPFRWGRATFSFLFRSRGCAWSPVRAALWRSQDTLPDHGVFDNRSLPWACVLCGTRENRSILDELAVHGLVRANTFDCWLKCSHLMARGGHKAFMGPLCSSYLQSINAKQA